MNTPSESILFFMDKSNHLHIIDPDALPYSDKEPPISLLVNDLIQAGYKGVFIDTYVLSSGVKFQSIQFDMRTPEGKLISTLLQEDTVPTLKKALSWIQSEYRYLTKRKRQKTDKVALSVAEGCHK